MNDYTILIKKSQDKYVALCLDLNVASQGDTMLEAKQQIFDAIQTKLDDLHACETKDVTEPLDLETLKDFLIDESHWMKIDHGLEMSENILFKVGSHG